MIHRLRIFDNPINYGIWLFVRRLTIKVVPWLIVLLVFLGMAYLIFTAMTYQPEPFVNVYEEMEWAVDELRRVEV